MHDPRVLARLVSCLTVAVVPFLSCGARQSPTSHTTAPSASSAPLSFAPSSASPLDAVFTVGPCTVSLGASPGSTYQFEPQQREAAIGALKSILVACLQKPALSQGTVFLAAQIDGNGAVSEAVPSPGGALATEVAVCLAERLGKLTLPRPATAPASLLVLVESSCTR